MRAAADAGLLPRTQQAFLPFESGAKFGAASPSADLVAVRQKYTDCLPAAATEVVHRLTATAIDKGTPGRDEVTGTASSTRSAP